MALPTPRLGNNWRLSQIAEELEALDMSLDMDAELRKIGNFNSQEIKSETIYSSTDVAGPKTDKTCSDISVGYVDFMKDIPKKIEETKKSSPYARCRGVRVLPVMPSVPPPPPPVARLPAPVPLPLPAVDDDSEEELPPPPPIFDLPEPIFGPPSPATSPQIHTLTPNFSTSSPLTLVTSAYSRTSNDVLRFAPSSVTSTYSGTDMKAPTSVTSTYSGKDMKAPTSVTSSYSGTSIYAPSSVTSTHSDTSDYAPSSMTSSSSDQPSDISDTADVAVIEKVSHEDIQQVEMFYRSHKAQVFVCPGLANLYFGPATPSGAGEKWELYKTGIPVLLMDSGDARRQRKIQIVLSEKGSGFILWKDIIDQLSNFKSVHSNFQSMYLSNDHTKLAGLSYDDESAANAFLRTLQEFTSDPNDEALRMGKKKHKVKKQKYKAPKKADISQPCGFVHVTKLDRHDHDQYVGQVLNAKTATTPILPTRHRQANDIRLSNGSAK